ncbi:glycoside hydrolase family 130 protein [Acidicapsa ligni]|uniref:glycoside hydrolase family 130 protein n=1 Tax=Acidicapsa ligni TaxID=542300 RepID=UPI0021E06E4F|nr:glycoside hydrolase family 130 protein [Acidicapsa ligni]
MGLLRSLLILFTALSAVPGLAQSAVSGQADWALGPFTRPVDEPILKPQPNSIFHDPLKPEPAHWEALHTFNPAAVVRHGKVMVLYRAEDDSGSMQIGGRTSRLGLAESADGIHFTRMPEPVFYAQEDSQKPREWPGGVEDPRLVEAPDGTYVLTYTQWNRTTYSIGIATSPDLVYWTKHGPALGDSGPYGKLMYKSASIVTKLDHGRLIAAKINGRFWMYWGEIEVRVASSPDLIHWTPVEDKTHQPVVVMRRRPGRFDSAFPEVGPPAILTSKGIVLVYNGKNALPGEQPDPKLAAGAYAAGQALFSKDNPTELLHQLDEPSLYPERPYEKSGQYAAGTTFAEGLVFFHDTWFLYYGCADSFVAVATASAGNAGASY